MQLFIVVLVHCSSTHICSWVPRLLALSSLRGRIRYILLTKAEHGLLTQQLWEVRKHAEPSWCRPYGPTQKDASITIIDQCNYKHVMSYGSYVRPAKSPEWDVFNILLTIPQGPERTPLTGNVLGQLVSKCTRWVGVLHQPLRRMLSRKAGAHWRSDMSISQNVKLSMIQGIWNCATISALQGLLGSIWRSRALRIGKPVSIMTSAHHVLLRINI